MSPINILKNVISQIKHSLIDIRTQVLKYQSKNPTHTCISFKKTVISYAKKLSF